jgi:ABC transporter substrate binding protein
MAFCMGRREFFSLLGGATIAWPLVAFAQKPDRTRRIGVLMSLEENDAEGKAQLFGFTQGLADLGWSDGTNLRMDVRWGGGDVNKIQAFAKELVAMQPDLILTQGTPVTAALQRETRTIPIVFVVVTDPVGEGFVAGLPRPGANITGFITSEASMGSKMLDLLLDIAPGINRVAMIFKSRHRSWRRQILSRRFRDCCPIIQSCANRSARSKRCRNRNHCNLAWTRTRWRSHCDAGLFHVEPRPADLVASRAKQHTDNLSVEVRRD